MSRHCIELKITSGNILFRILLFSTYYKFLAWRLPSRKRNTHTHTHSTNIHQNKSMQHPFGRARALAIFNIGFHHECWAGIRNRLPLLLFARFKYKSNIIHRIRWEIIRLFSDNLWSVRRKYSTRKIHHFLWMCVDVFVLIYNLINFR